MEYMITIAFLIGSAILAGVWALCSLSGLASSIGGDRDGPDY